LKEQFDSEVLEIMTKIQLLNVQNQALVETICSAITNIKALFDNTMDAIKEQLKAIADKKPFFYSRLGEITTPQRAYLFNQHLDDEKEFYGNAQINVSKLRNKFAKQFATIDVFKDNIFDDIQFKNLKTHILKITQLYHASCDEYYKFLENAHKSKKERSPVDGTTHKENLFYRIFGCIR